MLIRDKAVELTQEGADDHIDALANRYMGVDEGKERKCLHNFGLCVVELDVDTVSTRLPRHHAVLGQ